MPRNLFTCVSKKIPCSFVLSLLLVSITVYFLLALLGRINKPEPSVYSMKLAELENLHEQSLLILGDSTASRLDAPAIHNALFPYSKNGVSVVALGGAVPRTYLFILEEIGRDHIERNGTVVLWLSPYGLNKNNEGCLAFTVVDFFSFKEFINELVPNNKLFEMDAFLTNNVLHADRVNPFIRNGLGALAVKLANKVLPGRTSANNAAEPEINRDVIDEAMTSKTLNLYRTVYFKDYAVDSYQLAAISKIISFCKKEGLTLVMVIPPLSSLLRRVLGPDNLGRFIDAIYLLAERSRVAVIDYASSFNGREYDFYDGSHLTTHSAKQFNEKLIFDLKSLMEKAE